MLLMSGDAVVLALVYIANGACSEVAVLVSRKEGVTIEEVEAQMRARASAVGGALGLRMMPASVRAKMLEKEPGAPVDEARGHSARACLGLAALHVKLPAY